MSYRGFVHCKCFKEKKCIPPPYPDELKFAGEDFYFSKPSQQRAEPLFKMEAKVAAWKKTACLHPGMREAQAVVANDMGLEGFQKYIVKNGGRQVYPKVSRLMEQVGKQAIFAEEALLAEFRLLKKRAQLTATTKLVLKEEAAQRIIMIGDGDEETFFAMLKNGHVFLLKEGHFYILEQKGMENEEFSILFKARSFYTYAHQKTAVDYVGEKGERVQSIRGLGDVQKPGVKRKYEVQEESFNNYRYWKTIFEALDQLLTASVNTQNAILWESV